MTLGIGTRLGPYEILATLGAGGMGEVYRARDSKLGRDVALKILPDAFANDPDRIARFRREAQVLASLNHPNIAAIHGLEDTGPVTALVLELVEGPTLAEVIADSRLPPSPRASAGQAKAQGSRPGESQASGPKPHALSISDVLPIAKQIADALEAAHERGVIHRDLKPANIKVRPDGTVKVLDFGLAKALEPAQGSGLRAQGDVSNSPTITSPAMTALGMILGTAAYMAPEQAKGRPVDKRGDIWAFGCVVYEMVTGRPAFHGDDVSDTLANILKVEPDWAALPPDAPQALRRLLRRCLSKDLSGRLSDIGGARLEIADASSPTLAADTAPITVPNDSVTRSRWRDATLVVAGLTIAGGGFLVATYFRAATPAAATVRFGVAPAPGTRYPDQAIRAAISVSPDGRFVVFRAQRPALPTTLWLRALDSLEFRELPGTVAPLFAFWSPDSRSIGFVSTGQLKKIDVADGVVHTVAAVTNPVGASWSPDGLILLGNTTGGLWRVPAFGGEPVALTALDSTLKETGHVNPHFLPDGKRFLYTALPDNVVFLASLDSADRIKVIDGAANAQFAPPDYLLFLRQGSLLAQRFDASRGVVSGDAVPVAEQVRMALANQFGLFSISRTGVLAYEPAIGDSGGQPVWVDRRGADLGPATANLSDARFPRLSPDGRRLALIRRGDLWVEDLQGRPSIRLTSDGAQFDRFSPLWSPDGSRIIFEAQAGAQGSLLRSLPSDGSSSTATQVSPGGHFHAHGWSADGRGLLAVRLTASDEDIVLIPAGEKWEPRDVVATPANEGFGGASLSPDGRWLAYAADPTGQVEIWVRPFGEPGAPVRISPNGGLEPVWARSSRELFYLEGAKMMSVAIRPGQAFSFSPPEMLFQDTRLHDGQPPTFDVAADGRFLMLKPTGSVEPFTQPFTVVVNWIDELERRLRAR